MSPDWSPRDAMKPCFQSDSFSKQRQKSERVRVGWVVVQVAFHAIEGISHRKGQIGFDLVFNWVYTFIITFNFKISISTPSLKEHKATFCPT